MLSILRVSCPNLFATEGLSGPFPERLLEVLGVDTRLGLQRPSPWRGLASSRHATHRGCTSTASRTGTLPRIHSPMITFFPFCLYPPSPPSFHHSNPHATSTPTTAYF